MAATPILANGGYVGWRKVERIYVHKDEFLRIYPADSDFDNPANCDQSNFIYVPGTAVAFDRILSVVITAQAAGLEINGWALDCYYASWETAPVTRPKLEVIEMRNVPQ